MFTDKEHSTPMLRFKQFKRDWEQRKLKDISDRVTRKNKDNASKLPLTISAQDGLVDQNTYYKKQIASRDMSNYYLLKKGDFAYNKSYSNGFPLGVVKRLDKYEYGVLSTLYIVFRPTQINSDFLLFYYETNKWHKEVLRLSAEGARNHGLLNISVKDFFDTKMRTPISEKEQVEIGVFLMKLEKIINLQHNKMAVLEKIKKTYLHKMFL
ncbi:Type I restriction modification DNA specificity domain-containing protein [Lacicoccus alkaliphilus]